MNLATPFATLHRLNHKLLFLSGAALILALAPRMAVGQPSGGPYGPVEQTYQVPADAPHVFYVAPDGRDTAAGTSVNEPTTLAVAVQRATTGDAIILRGGTYRTGNLRFNQGITFQPFEGEHPILKGTLVATDWKAQPNGLWRVAWPHLFPAQPADWWQRERSGRETPPYRFNNDMVFVDGELLHAVGWDGQVDAHSYYIDYASGQVYIGVDPTQHQVEITAFDNAFTRVTEPIYGRQSDSRGPVIRGLTLTQYAYRAIEIEGKEAEGLSDPTTFGKQCVGTTLENDTITFCSRVAGYFRGDHLTIRNCLVSDTRTEGLYVLSSGDVLLERNIVRRNNIEDINGYFPAAIKIFDQCYHAVVRDNLIIDQPHSNGVWFDVGNVDAVFVNNWVEGAINGFFFEISKGATVAGNVFVNCVEGSRVLNSNNVHVYHNTYVNAVAVFDRTERSAKNDHFGWHPSTGPDVDQRQGHIFVGNLLVADETFGRAIFRTNQAPVLCGKLTKSQLKEMDGDVFVRTGERRDPQLLEWSPAEGQDCTAKLNSLQDFRKIMPDFETHGQDVAQYGAVFRSLDLRRLEPVRAYPSDVAVPDEVRKLVGWPAGVPLAAGAYPLTK